MGGFVAASARFFWALYAWAVFLALGLVTTLLMGVVPGLTGRRRVARFNARLAFRLAGIPLSVEWQARLPEGPCVVVANHASYLDGVILFAALPPAFSFVIKEEVRAVPLAHLLLRRLGHEFVERFDRPRSATDARRILRRAGGGEALAFFPEGTFRAEPGLGRFKSGAFVAAAKAGVPVVPVVIRGSRRVLPAGRLLPRPGRIEVVVTPPVTPPEVAGSPPARVLMAVSRERMLAVLGEPDLGTGP